MENAEILLSLRNLGVVYDTAQGPVHAVSNIDLDLRKNEVFGIAGESGCGKSTLIKSLLRLLADNGRTTADKCTYKGRDLLQMDHETFRKEVLWQEMSLVPQSAMASFNPVYRVGDQIVESMQAHKSISRAEAIDRAESLFDVVGLEPGLLRSYPHEFSGGMRQRAMIAMALSLDPGLIIMDEPTTGLDVLVQERILRRIREIRSELESSIILITHDIAVIAEMSDRIAIMYGGEFMEQAPTLDLFEKSYHPYTLGLKNAFPSIESLGTELISIPGSPPTLIGELQACPFSARCPFNGELCATENPALIEVSPDHLVRCAYHEKAPEFEKRAKEKSTWLC